ncbi:MAG TPA: sigma-54 dependent transcriptional regulator [Candidatus Hydrogenedentes bacterium]|nr:sigma-54 dependent transcriptional regulator [Candidatus Hydrogenedentota bacterium]HPG67801.1 sigma-54 dependent transcriptional regulator [Candidatus Hydrogenedentota bacterium]
MVDEKRCDVLLVDSDYASAREILAFLSGRGYTVEWVDTAEKAFNRLDSHAFEVLIADLGLGRGYGMRLMAVARERNADVCAVFMAERSDVELATEAMRQGAYDFQIRPINLGKLDAVIQRGLEHQRSVMAQHELRRRLDERYGLGSLVGQSRAMIRVYNTVRQAAATSASALIQGEPGTGKELVAQAIHNNGPRRDELFVKFDCANMPTRLQEIELLGHSAPMSEEGGHAWQGCAQLADRGTLFLDEVWALPDALQTQVVALLEHEHFARPGDGQRISSRVRILAASTRPLDKQVTAGAFQQRLYRLLSQVVIDMPPLRERREDIPLLVEHFARAESREMDVPFPGITRNGMDLLARYDWPANVRELRNIVQGMVAVAGGKRVLDVGDVPGHIRRETASEADEIRIPTGTPMDEVERIVIEQTLKLCEYDKRACAKTLGIGLRTLYRKINLYDIR